MIQMERVILLKKQLFSEKPVVCLDRAMIYTRVYRETDGQPRVIRQAKALAATLREMNIYIEDHQLIAGSQASGIRRAPLFPEFSYRWIKEEQDDFEHREDYAFTILPEDKENLAEIYEYWEGRTIEDRVLALRRDDVQRAAESMVISTVSENEGLGHYAIGVTKVINDGIRSILEDARRRRREIYVNTPEDMKGLYFYEAVEEVCSAVIDHANRYADLAEEMAAKEDDGRRRNELLRIAANCRNVPEHPARDFPEALQSFWFTQLLVQIESNGHGISPGRFDQYMYPYYRADLDSGRMTREQAGELLGCLWVKLAEIQKFRDMDRSRERAGASMFQNMTIAGQTVERKDATNELTWLLLDVTDSAQLVQPTLSLRWHPNIDPGFMARAIRTVKTGIGMPAFFNDEEILQNATEELDIPWEDAFDYAIEGCVEISIPGRSDQASDTGYVNLPKCLELALNDGVDPLTGVQVGPRTGNADDFKSYDKLWDAFEAQLRHATRLLIESHLITDIMHARVLPLPLLSAITGDCMERGREVHAGGSRYHFSRVFGIGVVNTTDSLVAVRRFVFEDENISIADLRKALASDFRDDEPLRQMLINRAPKYGNDDDYADSMARDIVRVFSDEVGRHRTMQGDTYIPSLITIAKNVLFGKYVGASAEGRHAFQPIADGGVSPMAGRDLHGPTAVIGSAAKFSHLRLGGTLLNLKLSPAAVAGEDGERNFSALIRTYFERGGHHVQFNVVDRDTLVRAQENPQEYENLIVRVAGFSAFFCQLDRDVQDSIIARTEHAKI